MEEELWSKEPPLKKLMIKHNISHSDLEANFNKEETIESEATDGKKSF